ncbi:Importin subunit beta-3 like [Actinidia chinensis var. chinensis]|uniref:Importin subunit beta-3 like n=1 Tax=Actinidia chinensis var. chinensis TaxID=1590841 RepID=A0A2R6RX17_ACTCC|nr:Importin subunit beta-3 like [Actinidia chinensis var. chinensis]
MDAQLTLHCYKVLSLPLPVTESTLSRILGTIVQTYTGIEGNQNCCSTFYYAIGSNATAQADSAVLNFCENCTPNILTPYLDGIVSKLLVLLQSNSMLRAKAMECIISLVGMAVGKEKFRDDAKQLRFVILLTLFPSESKINKAPTGCENIYIT